MPLIIGDMISKISEDGQFYQEGRILAVFRNLKGIICCVAETELGGYFVTHHPKHTKKQLPFVMPKDIGF